MAKWTVLQHCNIFSDFSYIVMKEEEIEYPILVYTDSNVNEYVRNNPDCDLLKIVS